MSLQVLILLFISPSGIIGGWAYTIDPRLPFGLMIAAFAVSIVLLIVQMNRVEKRPIEEGAS